MPRRGRAGWGRRPTTVLALVGGAWGLALAVNRSLRRVRGGSMAPTLQPGELVLTLPVGRPRRGEVVLVRDPRDRAHVQVKRVVGLPGEVVEVRGGPLLLDGRPHLEPYAPTATDAGGSVVVPAGHVAVLGDARDASTDSRTYGPVPLDLVDRRVPVVLRGWPRRLQSAPVPVDGP